MSKTDPISEDLALLMADADAVRVLRRERRQTTRTTPGAGEPEHTLSETITSALTHEAADLVQKKLAELSQFDGLNEQVERLTKEIERAAKAHPAVALLAAGALGFAFAQFMTKR